MSLFSFFKHKPRTKNSSYRNYRRNNASSRKAFKPKKRKIRSKNRITRRKNEKIRRFLNWLKLLTGFLLFLILAYVLFFSSFFEIQKIDVKGESDTIEEQTAINEYLQNFLGKNMLSVNITNQEQILMKEYSYLKEISIHRAPFHTIVAVIETYKNAANVQINHEDGSKQFYIINELGYIASIGTSDESIPTIVMDVTGTDLDLPEEGDKLSLNQELIEQETMETLLKAERDFEGKFNMQILELHYLKRARELHLYTERYFFVWIDLGLSVDAQLAKLKKALTELNIYEADLEYIDLRISGQNGEKVIYKTNSTEN